MFPLISRTRKECLHTIDVRQGNYAKKKKKEERKRKMRRKRRVKRSK